MRLATLTSRNPLVSAIFWAVLFCSSTSLAADSLAGLRRVNVSIEGTASDDAKDCGIDRQSLETSARFVLQQSKLILVNPDQTQGTLFVRPIAVALRNFAGARVACAVVVSVGLRVPVSGTTSFGKFVGWPTIWEMVYQVNGPDAMGKQASDAAETLVKQFVVEWSQANK